MVLQMSNFDTLFAEQAAPLLMSQFGDSIVYVPRVGQSRTIQAMIEYSPPQLIGETGHVQASITRITVFDDAVTGIAGGDLDTSGDKIQITRWPDEPVITLSIMKRERQQGRGGGLLVLDCS